MTKLFIILEVIALGFNVSVFYSWQAHLEIEDAMI